MKLKKNLMSVVDHRTPAINSSSRLVIHSNNPLYIRLSEQSSPGFHIRLINVYTTV